MKPARVSWLLALALGAAAPAQTSEASEQTFSADRPGFTTSTAVLRPGLAQVEGGVSFSVDRDGGVRRRTMTFGSPTVRIGVSGRAELRAGGRGLDFVRSADRDGCHSKAGWSDLSAGAKVAVSEEGRLVPAISLLPALSIPAGTPAFSSSSYDPSLAIAWHKNLAAGVSVGGTLTAASLSVERRRRAWRASAVSVGIPLPKRTAGFVDIYAASSEGPEKGSAWVADAGASHNFGPNLQLDIAAGRRIFYGAPCWFVATGFALRHSLLGR